MKTIIIAAFIIAIGLVGCSISQPAGRVYYPQQRGYSTSPVYQYDPYYNPVYNSRYYSNRRNYNYNNGRYYNNKVYNSPSYPNRTSIKDNERREGYREQPKQNNEVRRERRLPDGTKVSPSGTVTLPNGRRRQ